MDVAIVSMNPSLGLGGPSLIGESLEQLVTIYPLRDLYSRSIVRIVLGQHAGIAPSSSH